MMNQDKAVLQKQYKANKQQRINFFQFDHNHFGYIKIVSLLFSLHQLKLFEFNLVNTIITKIYGLAKRNVII